MEGRPLVLTAVIGLAPAAGAFARGANATMSIAAVANPVATTGCLATGCQTYLNPAWSFSANDLRYRMTNGLDTSSIPCFAIHTDLGTLGALSGASGADTTAPPPGAPESGGEWRTWCSSSLPTSVQGESRVSLQIGSTRAGTATITAYLLRGAQISTSFSSAIIAQTSFDLVFGAAKPPSLSTTYGWALGHASGIIGTENGVKGKTPIVNLQAVSGSGTFVVGPSGAVSKANGRLSFRFLLTESVAGVARGVRSVDLKVLSSGAKFARIPGGGIAVEMKVTATGSPLDAGSADCLESPDGELVLSDGPAGSTAFALRGVCGLKTVANSFSDHLQLTIAPR